MFKAIKIGLLVSSLMICGLFIAAFVIDSRISDESAPTDKYAFRETLLVPLSNARLVALFNDSNFESGTGSHRGIDLQGAKGLPIRAAAEGFVSRTGADPSGNGKRIMVLHTSVKGVFATEYIGKFDPLVKVGDYVGRGKAIAEASIDSKTFIHFAALDYEYGYTDPCRFIVACRNIALPEEREERHVTAGGSPTAAENK